MAAGILVPDVWQRFLAEGLDSWPYTAILIWSFTFFMLYPPRERGGGLSAAAAFALTWWAIPPKFSPKKKAKK